MSSGFLRFEQANFTAAINSGAHASVTIRINQLQRPSIDFKAAGGAGQRNPQFLVELIQAGKRGA